MLSVGFIIHYKTFHPISLAKIISESEDTQDRHFSVVVKNCLPENTSLLKLSLSIQVIIHVTVVLLKACRLEALRNQKNAVTQASLGLSLGGQKKRNKNIDWIKLIVNKGLYVREIFA